MAQCKQTQLVSMRIRVRSLASLSGYRIPSCHELWCRLQTWLGSRWLWLWCRPAAVALIRPLDGEPPYAVGVAQKKKKKKKKKEKNQSAFQPQTQHVA